MGIAVSIFLIALGAILAFATNVAVSGLDLDILGWVLMLVGILGLVLTLVVWAPRRRTTTVERVDPGVAPRRRVVEERRTYDDPPL